MRLIERDLKNKILPWMDRDEIIVIIGSRQVGKTTLVRLLLNDIPEGQKAYFDLEDMNILGIMNQGPHAFVNYLRLLGYPPEKRVVVALDEIQYIDNPSNFLKIIHDHHPNIKLIVSGSSTLEIRQKFKDSLAGRKVVFELDSLNFLEFLRFKGDSIARIKENIGTIQDILENRFNPSSGLVKNELLPYLYEYLVFGGYPKVSQSDDMKLKVSILNEIYSSYVRKDIKDIANIEDILAFNNLLKLLSAQAGNMVNINEISGTLGINVATAKKYLFLLENTFIVSLLNPYFKNKRKEISKMPKVYLLDNGLRNTALSNFQLFGGRGDEGLLFENYVFSELKKRFQVNKELFYWRTIAKAEVDFILNINNRIVPIEAKAHEMKQPALTRSFRSFIDSYKPDAGIVVNQSFSGTMEYGGCKIYFVPAYGI